MDSIHICGGCPLNGETRIQGSKNAVLPVLAATVLVDGVSTLYNCPDIADVHCMIRLLRSTGCKVKWQNGEIRVDARRIACTSLPQAYVQTMRSSVVMMGALLGRMGEVHISYPGGCVIGKRPIDMHLQAFARMGVTLEEACDGLTACAKHLAGAVITLAFPSVGATENCILAAVLAKGETLIRNAAREPEIDALCDFLRCAGGDICRETDGSLRIRGRERLCCCAWRVPPDRIVAGTYLLGCMAAGGRIRLADVDTTQLDAVLAVIEQMGGKYESSGDGIILAAPERVKAIPYIRTEVYPGYPTDLQSQLLAALALAEGESIVEETVFENRFRVVPELVRMGAHINIEENHVTIKGVARLHGSHVKAEELRGGAALCMAALAAQGDSCITNRHFIDRGYQALEQDIRNLGGRI